MPQNAPSNPPAAPSTAPPRLPPIGFHRFSAVELLISLVLLFVVTPFVEDLPGGELVEALLMSSVFVAAVLAVGGRRRMLSLAAIFVLPAMVGKWVNHFRPDLVPATAFRVAALAFGAFVIVQLLRFVLRAPRVTNEVLCAALSAYLMLGLVWAFAYILAAGTTPGAFAFNAPLPARQSFDGGTAFYFSFVTLSTLGYGDIVPVSRIARMLATLEAMSGPLYVAVLIARLVALYSAPGSSNPSQAPDQSPEG